MNAITSSLRDHFLIATPTLQDPFFEKTVTYICEHTREGAMGLVINRPLSVSFDEILANMGISTPNTSSKTVLPPIYAGGPVQPDRGFILHTPSQQEWEMTFPLNERLSLTTSRDMLEALSQNTGPEHYLFTLGYAAWEKEQLEQEIAENAWLWVPASDTILFDLKCSDRFEAATKTLGISLDRLSPAIGHA